MNLFLLAQLAAPAWAEGPHLLAEVLGSGPTVIEFGFSAALEGPVAVFGAPKEDDGAVYVFEEQFDGSWLEVYRLAAPRDTAGFGNDVAIDGGRVVAGGIGERAHLLERVGAGWVHTQALAASDGERSFGHAVAISGDTVVVGALSRDGGVGGAYVFERDPATGRFEETQILVPAAALAGGAYGGDVAIDGDTLALAADWAEQVVVYQRDPVSGAFVEAATLAPADGSGVSAAVSVDGDRLVLGNLWDANWDGAAYVFDRDPVSGAWAETQRLEDPAPPGAGNFGSRVRVEGDLVAVAAKAAWGAVGGGAVVVFRLGPEGWVPTAKVYPPDPDDEANFGGGVGLSDERLVVGARLQHEPNVGAGYLFDLVPTELSASESAPRTWAFEASGFTPHGPVRALVGTISGAGVVPVGVCADRPVGLVDPAPWKVGAADPWGLGHYTTRGTPRGRMVVLVDETTCVATPPLQLP